MERPIGQGCSRPSAAALGLSAAVHSEGSSVVPPCLLTGDDLAVKFGMPFTRLVKPRSGETVVFSWVVFKSRAHRDKVNAKAMADKRLQKMPKTIPFAVPAAAINPAKPLPLSPHQPFTHQKVAHLPPPND